VVLLAFEVFVRGSSPFLSSSGGEADFISSAALRFAEAAGAVNG
jgi:hypothetical protein